VKLIMIDNYDSFTYNLVQYLSELGAHVRVFRNDAVDIETIRKLKPNALVISPGPCTPDEAGISLEVVDLLKDEFPILGVCLGHQSIGQAFGGSVVRANKVMHGKTSMIYHTGLGIFTDLPNPFVATRYHSLIVDQPLPDCLEMTAWTQLDSGEVDEVMAIEHREHPILGMQFHPESILTQEGHRLLGNFLLRLASFSA